MRGVEGVDLGLASRARDRLCEEGLTGLTEEGRDEDEEEAVEGLVVSDIFTKFFKRTENKT